MSQSFQSKETIRNAGRFGVGLLILVVGAIMIAEGVLGWVSGNSMFFPDVNDTFVFWVGLLSVMIGSTFMSFFPGRKWTSRTASGKDDLD